MLVVIMLLLLLLLRAPLRHCAFPLLPLNPGYYTNKNGWHGLRLRPFGIVRSCTARCLLWWMASSPFFFLVVACSLDLRGACNLARVAHTSWCDAAVRHAACTTIFVLGTKAWNCCMRPLGPVHCT